MRAAVFEKVGVLTVKDIPKPVIEAGDEIIIKIEVCSICGTDVHIMEDPPGYVALPGTVLGHELVGEIVEIGADVKTLKVGDRVVLNPNDYCGVCDYCKANLPNFCENLKPMGIEVDGGFAEYVKATEKVAYKISPDLPAEIAAFAEPLACLMNGKNKIPVNPGDKVLVCGAGAIGLLFTQIVKAAGAGLVIVSEPNATRREYAKLSGADIVVDPINEDLNAIVHEASRLGMDYCIDVVGSQLQTCLDNVRKGGTVLLFGINDKAVKEIKQGQITMNEIRVQGTWIANASFPAAVRVLESGILNLKPLITHTMPLEQVREGIELLAKGEGIEILIDPNL